MAEPAVSVATSDAAVSEPVVSVATSNALVSEFYDACASSYNASGTVVRLESQFLTFGPFPEVAPGFNWLNAFSAAPGTVQRRLMEAAKITMRNVIYRHVNWERTRRVFDFGCGQGVDLCLLAKHHPGLVGEGFTLSPEQAARGKQNAVDAGVQDLSLIHI